MSCWCLRTHSERPAALAYKAILFPHSRLNAIYPRRARMAFCVHTHTHARENAHAHVRKGTRTQQGDRHIAFACTHRACKKQTITKELQQEECKRVTANQNIRQRKHLGHNPSCQ